MEIKLSEEERRLRITDPGKLFPIFQKIYQREGELGLHKEHFWVVGLKYTGTLGYIELAAVGQPNRVAISPGDVYQLALMRCIRTVIVVHNHPGGQLVFSPEDLDLSDKLIQVGRMVDIDLADHIIITDKDYTSLRVLGLYDELYNSPKHVTDYIRQEMELVRVKSEARKKQWAIAYNLYNEGMAVDKISEITEIDVSDLRGILDIEN
ncbi:MAG: hypothetical protein LUE10_03860 [Alistipes sp.]|nr:hypothetical protein [Alistipes sp.]